MVKEIGTRWDNHVSINIHIFDLNQFMDIKIY